MDFFERYKKLVLFFAFILSVLVLGYLIYSVFFKTVLGPASQPAATSSTSANGLPQAGLGSGSNIVQPGSSGRLTGQTANQATTSPSGQTPASPVAQGGLTQVSTLTDSPSLGINIAQGGQAVRFYNATDGKFYKIDANGARSPMSDKTFYSVDKVTWSPTNDKAIMQYPDGSKIIYDFDQQKQITLPAHWKDFSFSPDGSRLVFKSLANDVNNRWLAITSSDGNQVYTVERLADDASVIPSWSPNKQMVAMYTEGENLNTQSVYFVGLNGENFKSTEIDGRDFRPQWSPKGDQLVYSVYSDNSDLKPTLWAVQAQGDQIGQNRRRLNLDTWADKCAFADNSTLYCAVPQTLDRGAGLFPKMAENTPDDIYKVDLNTNSQTKIATPEQDATIVEMTVSPDGRTLFFNDRATGQLHKINLK